MNRRHKIVFRNFYKALNEHVEAANQRAREAGYIVSPHPDGIPCSRCGKKVGALVPVKDEQLCGYCWNPDRYPRPEATP